MRFIIGNRKLLEQSRFYNKDKCWDYPLEELEYVLQQSNPRNDMIYVICENNRMYETLCSNDKLNELYSELKKDRVLKESEEACLSIYIKLYTKAGEKIANKKFEEWQNRMADCEPNIKEIMKQAKVIIGPLEQKRSLRHTLDFDFSYLNNHVFDYCNQNLDIVKEFAEQFKDFIEEKEEQEELEED